MSSVQFEEELTGEGVSRGTPSTFQLVVFMDGGVVLRPLSGKRSVTIGRAREEDVVVPHHSVSRHHAVLDLSAMTFTDEGSRNGSTIHGKRVAPNEPITIGPGDAIVVGDITMILQIEGATVPNISLTTVQDA